jgi:hypothetical protein
VLSAQIALLSVCFSPEVFVLVVQGRDLALQGFDLLLQLGYLGVVDVLCGFEDFV